MRYTLGFSTCPNDTFIFDALVNKKIDTEGLEFDIVLEDIETLNQWALDDKLDISKLSFPSFFKKKDSYVLLNSGSALGKGVGPLLIKKENAELPNIESCSITIPGINTTANLLLDFSFPKTKFKISKIFSSIEEAVLNGETELGVIIHENRFTYHQKGLEKVADLGALWEQKMNLPIPLGGIAIKRSIDPFISSKIQTLIRKSLEFAWENYPTIPQYVQDLAQSLNENVIRQHIELYVNNYSLTLEEEGRNAILKLQEIYMKNKLEDSASNPSIFLNELK
ncbi:MAG: 1,4-dihydroxy-6-naphthoate synthase [Chitinophagaceae bacterium]|nr:MAG: 1,4-dihydroxy-6-naphthoate synthase [Chitinophagaceae bacterium]